MKQPRAFLPQLQADETIYSWCATAYAMSGWRSAQEWSRALLGADHAPRQLDLPAYLPGLLKTTQYHLTLQQAVRRHTTAGMFMPFVKGSVLARLSAMNDVSQMDWPHAPQFMRKVLFCHSRTLSWKTALRYCPGCAQTDVTRIGRPYWHTQHQWPLSHYCILHHAPLVSARSSPKTWQLPPTATNESAGFGILPEPFGIEATVQRVATAFSEMETVNVKALRASALLRLRRLGVIHSMHAVRHTRLHEWYRSQPIAAWLAAESGGLAALADPEWIPKLLWRKTQDHPIRWIILWSALGWSHEESAVGALNAALARVPCDECGQQMLFDHGDYGVYSGQAEPAPQAFRRALETASSYAELMMNLKATRGDVVRWLEADAASRKSWRKRLHDNRVLAAEQELTQLIRNTSRPSRADINKVASKAIRLLRRYAPDRLNALLNAVPSEGDAQRSLWDNLPLR